MTKAERMAMEAYPPKIEYAGQPGLEFDINELNRIIYADAFKAGAEWQEEQMMKNAVEAEIGYEKGCDAHYLSVYDADELEGIILSHFDEGDKVKIVIVKEDKK